MTRLTDTVVIADDEDVEGTLRPRRLGEFVGQERVKEQLAIVLEAA
jgi:Holliday junction DNA helicase RuvB